MANLDLMSYERDSRWQPHLSWAYPDTTHQQRMQQQAVEREQAWQRIADKLGPLLVGSDVGGSYGQSDYISRDICEDQDYQERAYEKAPLLSSAKYPNSNSARNHKDTTSMSRSTNLNNNNNHNHLGSDLNNISKGNKQLNSQRNSNLNLYAQQHYVQMPQRGNLINPHQSKQQNSHQNSSNGCQLFLRLSVMLLVSLLLLFSLLLFFFYFNK